MQREHWDSAHFPSIYSQLLQSFTPAFVCNVKLLGMILLQWHSLFFLCIFFSLVHNRNAVVYFWIIDIVLLYSTMCARWKLKYYITLSFQWEFFHGLHAAFWWCVWRCQTLTHCKFLFRFCRIYCGKPNYYRYLSLQCESVSSDTVCAVCTFFGLT